MATNFPTSLQDLDATRGTTGQKLNNPDHITHHTTEDDTVEALQAKVGIDNSAVTTSLDYLVKSASSTDPGHKHPASKIVNTPAGSIAATDIQTAINELDTEKAPIASPTFTGTATAPTVNVSGLTASEIVATDASKNLQSLAVATYPSLTELSYIKGLTSAIQSQLNARYASGDNPTFGNVTTTGNVELGHASDTTISRVSAGVIAVEGNNLIRANDTSTTSAAGVVELATTAEINTGTDSTRAMPVDQFVASNRNVRYILFRVKEKTTDWDADGTTAVGGDLVIPFTGTIVDIEADVDTAGTTGTAIVDVNLNGSTIMTTNKLKWDSTEKSTRTYSGTAPGITTSAVTAGDIITVDIDTNHTTKSKGLTVFLAIRLT